MSTTIRQAIQTKYSGPTNTRQARIIARCSALRSSFDYDYELSDDANHHAAALAIATRLGWSEPFVTGVLHDVSRVHVFTDAPALAPIDDAEGEHVELACPACGGSGKCEENDRTGMDAYDDCEACKGTGRK